MIQQSGTREPGSGRHAKTFGFVVLSSPACVRHARKNVSVCSQQKSPSPPEDDADKRNEKVDLKTYVFGKPGEFARDLRALGTERRRFLNGIGLSLLVAFGGNLLGSASWLLSLFPGLSRSARLDILYPVRGFKRFQNDDLEFIYPQSWLEDQAVALFATTRNVKALDYSMSKAKIAFGPAGGDARENVSVIKSNLLPGFSLSGTLGPPDQAAETLLRQTIAPEGSSRTGRLVAASARPSGLYYTFEYVIKGPGFENHNLSVVCARATDNALFTFTILAPEKIWSEVEGTFREAADSFTVAGIP